MWPRTVDCPARRRKNRAVHGFTKHIAKLITTRRRLHTIRAGGRLHRALFRAFHGAGFLGTDTLILTTRGRRTGRPRATPLYYLEENGRRYVAAGFAGSDTPPLWYLNLLEDPLVEVEVKGSSSTHLAHVLPGPAAREVWEKLVAMYPPFAVYQTRTERHIPVIELIPAPQLVSHDRPRELVG